MVGQAEVVPAGKALPELYGRPSITARVRAGFKGTFRFAGGLEPVLRGYRAEPGELCFCDSRASRSIFAIACKSFQPIMAFACTSGRNSHNVSP